MHTHAQASVGTYIHTWTYTQTKTNSRVLSQTYWIKRSRGGLQLPAFPSPTGSLRTISQWSQEWQQEHVWGAQNCAWSSGVAQLQYHLNQHCLSLFQRGFHRRSTGFSQMVTSFPWNNPGQVCVHLTVTVQRSSLSLPWTIMRHTELGGGGGASPCMSKGIIY